jgi:hypothetical protein
MVLIEVMHKNKLMLDVSDDNNEFLNMPGVFGSSSMSILNSKS